MNRESNSTWRFVYTGPEGTDIVVIETNDKALFDNLLEQVANQIIRDGFIFQKDKQEKTENEI